MDSLLDIIMIDVIIRNIQCGRVSLFELRSPAYRSASCSRSERKGQSRDTRNHHL
jgi:hypothetical protein